MSKLTYSWEIRYDSTCQSPFGDAPKMPLWLAILEANETLESVKEEQEDFWQDPEARIEAYIDNEYDDEVEFYEEWDGKEFSASKDGFKFEYWEQVVEWAETQYNKGESEALKAASQVWREKNAQYLSKLA